MKLWFSLNFAFLQCMFDICTISATRRIPGNMNVWLFSLLVIYLIICTTSSLREKEVTFCKDCRTFPKKMFGSQNVSGFSVIKVINQTGGDVLVGARGFVLVFSTRGLLKKSLRANLDHKIYDHCKRSYEVGPREESFSEACGLHIRSIACNGKDPCEACGLLYGYGHVSCYIINDTRLVKISKDAYNKLQFFSFPPFVSDSEYFVLNKENRKFQLFKFSVVSTLRVRSTLPFQTDPTFISMYEYRNYIYYFFVELPSESRSDRENQVFYSRVGRVCKFDWGDENRMHFISLTKARLVCQRPPGDLSKRKAAVTYNILVQTSVMEGDDGELYIYGLFRAAEPNNDMFAVCRYNFSDISAVLSSARVYKFSNVHAYPSILTLPQDDPRHLKCNESLASAKVSQAQSSRVAFRSITVENVKPNPGKPIIERSDPNVKLILSDLWKGPKYTYDIMWLFGPDTVYGFAVPKPLPSKGIYFSAIKFAASPLHINVVKKVKDVLIIGAEEKLIFLPMNSCQSYNTCRECVASKNPFCVWSDEGCVRYNQSHTRSYVEDENGNYSKVCPQVKVATKLIRMSEIVPFKTITLFCLFTGVPKPSISEWLKDGVPLNLPSANFEQRLTREGVELKIRRYSVETAGRYACRASNGYSSDTRSVEIPGSLPKIRCEVRKTSKLQFCLACNISGYPQPKISENDSGEQATNSCMLMREGRKYQSIVYNVFGIDKGLIYEPFSLPLEFEIVAPWNADYGKVGSRKYKELRKTIVDGINDLFKDYTRFFVVSNVTFRQGSTMVSLRLYGVETPSFHARDLTELFLKALKAKRKFGNFTIQEYEERKPETTKDQQSSTTRQRSSTARPPSSTTPRSTRPLETTTRQTDSRTSTSDTQFQAAATHTGSRSSSSGVKVWVVILVVIFVALIVFIFGYCCGMKKLLELGCLGKTCSSKRSSYSDEDTELKGMHRSEKGRESERMLLKRHERSKPISPAKKNNHDIPNNISKHGSVEITRNDHCEEDGKNTSDHSVC